MNHASLSQRLASWIPWLFLLAAAALVALQVERVAPLIRVWGQWAEVGTLAIVMTAIIITGGIDLSVGSMAALAAVVVGVLWRDAAWPIAPAALAGIATGVAAGAGNGLLVVWAGISPLVATLATMAFYSGLAMTVARAERIAGFPESFLRLSDFAGCPASIVLLVLITCATYLALHQTPFGRWCFAIGDNPTAARFAATPVGWTRFLLYAASGLAAGLTGVLSVASRDTATPDLFRGVELQAIACVVVGGTLITGGHGGVLQTLLGLAIVSLLDIGLKFLNVRFSLFSPESRMIVIGALLILFAVLNERTNAHQQTNRE